MPTHIQDAIAVLENTDQCFATILIDPPWPARRFRGSLIPGGKNTPPMKRAPLPYPTLSVPEITGLRVREVAAEHAHLYLWTTQRFLHDAFHVAQAWGFKMGAVLVWSKPPKGVVGTWVASAEFLLFCRRGNLRAKRKHLGTVICAPRGERHSAKPEHVQDLIEAVSPGPYLEVFARRHREGWTCVGDECRPAGAVEIEIT